MCTSLCTISWLSFYVCQGLTLLKVYFPFSTSLFQFSSSSRTPLGAPWRCNDPWRDGRAAKIIHENNLCNTLWISIITINFTLLHISELSITFVLQREKYFYSRIEYFLTANRKHSDREQKHLWPRIEKLPSPYENQEIEACASREWLYPSSELQTDQSPPCLRHRDRHTRSWANMWPMERWSACPASAVASALHRVTSDGKNSENDVKKLYPKVIVHK